MKIKRFVLSSIGVFLSICSVSTWADDFVSNLTIQETSQAFVVPMAIFRRPVTPVLAVTVM
ncbi:hypothetical protein ACFSJQ_17335 [Vibrio olivae]